MRREADCSGWKVCLVPCSTVTALSNEATEEIIATYMKYSNASSFDFRMSCKSRAIRARLVGSMLYFASSVTLVVHGYMLLWVGETLSGTGPTMSEGQMTDSAFSKWIVSSRPAPECSDSKDEYEDAWLILWDCRAGGDTEALERRWWRGS